MNRLNRVVVENHVEAAAVAVILGGMGFADTIEGVGLIDNQWTVQLKKPVPDETIQIIMAVIRRDQKNDPEKWNKSLNQSLNQSPEHPNLRPVFCRTQDDMRKLGEELRKAASGDITQFKAGEDYKASEGEVAAQFNCEMAAQDGMQEDMTTSGTRRFMAHAGRIVCCVISLDKYDDLPDKKVWNLSISMQPEDEEAAAPDRVPDDVADMLVGSVLGEEYKEVAPKAAFKGVRHFVKEENT